MFLRRRRPQRLPEGFVQIGQGARLRGRLDGQGLALILGHLTGEISLSGELIVALGGIAQDLRGAVDRLRVEGEAEVQLNVFGVIEVIPGGVLRGDVVARKLDAAPGATVSAELRIDS